MSEQHTFNGGPSGPSDLIKDADTKSFMNDVIKASTEQPVIVDFWTPGSPACAELTSKLEALVTAAGGAVKMVKINLAENQTLAAQFQIQSVPTVYAISNGQPVDGFQGLLPDPELKKFISKLSGDKADISAYLEMAEQKLAEGETAAAAEIFTAILRQDPESPESLAGLIKCYIEDGELKAARETLEMLDEDLSNHPAIKSARSALDLAEQAEDAGDLGELKTAVEQNPDDHQKRYDLAFAYAAKNQRTEAVDELINIIRKDLNWQDGAARTQLIAFFDAWGPKDENSIRGRKELASLLF